MSETINEATAAETERPAKNRIWELDFFRGVCILGVVIIHVVLDLLIFGVASFTTPPVFNFIQQYGGILFIILSGICVTLGHHPIRRGLIVFGCALVISVVTYIIFQNTYDMIWFGILHLLGCCMLLYPLLKRIPTAVLPALGAVAIALGIWFARINVTVPFLFPLGLTTATFGSSDWFPLFPHLGFFMFGIFIGRTLYKKQQTLFPNVNTQNPVIRFFSFCGRHSLWIYLGHQPISLGIMQLILLLRH